MELLCSGKCSDDTECKPGDFVNVAGNKKRQTCRCKEGKGSGPKLGCYPTLYKVEKPGRPIEWYFACEEPDYCDDDEICYAVPIGNEFYKDDSGKLKWMEFECKCLPKDDPQIWPKP